jgi:hypothetical protein
MKTTTLQRLRVCCPASYIEIAGRRWGCGAQRWECGLVKHVSILLLVKSLLHPSPLNLTMRAPNAPPSSCLSGMPALHSQAGLGKGLPCAGSLGPYAVALQRWLQDLEVPKSELAGWRFWLALRHGSRFRGANGVRPWVARATRRVPGSKPSPKLSAPLCSSSSNSDKAAHLSRGGGAVGCIGIGIPDPAC